MTPLKMLQGQKVLVNVFKAPAQVSLFPGEEPCSGPDGPPAAASASPPRGESPSAPPEGRQGGGSAVFRRALTCMEDSESQQQNKSSPSDSPLTLYNQHTAVQKLNDYMLYWIIKQNEAPLMH